MIQIMDSLDDLLGWPIDEIINFAAPLHINVKVAKSYTGRRKTHYAVSKEVGDILVALEDGKVVEIWQEK